MPKGLLKTDQVLTEAEAELLARTWDKKYAHGMKNRVAVLGKGTEYQPLTFSPDVLKLYDMKKWNLYTLLAKYGIPPRVANIEDSKSSLSGTDTDSQHRAFWNYTLIPLLKNFEEVLEINFKQMPSAMDIFSGDLTVENMLMALRFRFPVTNFAG